LDEDDIARPDPSLSVWVVCVRVCRRAGIARLVCFMSQVRRSVLAQLLFSFFFEERPAELVTIEFRSRWSLSTLD
jgi:hypothetical protein